MIRCTACLGRKSLYKINNIYTLTDITGGKAVKCPECGGIGQILSDDEKAVVKAEQEAKSNVAKGEKVKDIRDVKKVRGA